MRTASMTLRRAVVSLALLAVATGVGAQEGPDVGEGGLGEALRRAIESPQDDELFEDLLRLLPKVRLGHSVRFVVEGDLLMSRREVRDHLARTAQDREVGDKRPELLLNLDDEGYPTYWKTRCSRRLGFTIDEEGFSETELVYLRDAMSKAAKAWGKLCRRCRISFTERAAGYASGECEGVRFPVRKADAAGPYLATAFFPDDDETQRVVWVFPAFFNDPPYPQAGILRHELGHVLGYRHEHTRGIAGCDVENDNWRPLTKYDPHSVMHYFCGGGGTLSFKLTRIDRAGHRKLYRSR